ncbi:hypothetical protein GJW-30_1_03638 [Variibacter gotjawalensis]|uniref:Trypsin n=1 Tax=Variibacter gotjawalensis TaxID=1333996 RepID=A0A0S3PYT8_9BRAD|nr:serine protease [Variibacter gotjawalensis]NIK46924.1 hypothetical protein [Variibacter gotjawalensis]RZS48828.1 trypsin-like peptidase [Variibacter gotjawalensis]BAT61087.1 hypothetical protein GJW-30_1_03638 [Variibacter gotjawalensis]
MDLHGHLFNSDDHARDGRDREGVVLVTASSNSIGIFKTLWSQDDVGQWAVKGMKGIDLVPREGAPANYFKIANQLTLMTDRPGDFMSNFFFTTFGTTEFIVRQSIVPVVAWNDGDEEMRCIGTGFFISASGLLMTAAHVFRDPVDENYSSVTEVAEAAHQLGSGLRFGILLPANPAMRNAPFDVPATLREAIWFLCPFESGVHWGREFQSPLFHLKPEFKLELDIAVCKVRYHPMVGPFQPLNIGLYNLEVGDRAVAIGYPEMRNIRLDGDDYQPELVVSVGSVTAIYPDNITNKQNATPGPNFEFDAKIPGKMSGSPVLVGGGIITKGIVSRSLGSADNHASGCLIGSIMK